MPKKSIKKKNPRKNPKLAKTMKKLSKKQKSSKKKAGNAEQITSLCAYYLNNLVKLKMDLSKQIQFLRDNANTDNDYTHKLNILYTNLEPKTLNKNLKHIKNYMEKNNQNLCDMKTINWVINKMESCAKKCKTKSSSFNKNKNKILDTRLHNIFSKLNITPKGGDNLFELNLLFSYYLMILNILFMIPPNPEGDGVLYIPTIIGLAAISMNPGILLSDSSDYSSPPVPYTDPMGFSAPHDTVYTSRRISDSSHRRSRNTRGP
jgi:hypothetical protein